MFVRNTTLVLTIVLLCVIKTTFSYRPNVLFVILDDLKPVLGSYGDSRAHTPNIDRLSSRSFVFTQAYAQQALCAPSRNSFLTSRRPDTLHLYDFYSYWRHDVGNFTTMPQYFKEHGYHTYSIGKVFHPGTSSNNSDDQPYSWSETPFHPKTEKFMNAKVCPNPDGSVGMNLICPVVPQFQPLGTLPDIESQQEAVRYIRQRRASDPGIPYFLALGFHKPHVPFKFPVQYLNFHPLDNVSLPTNLERPPLLPQVAWTPWTDIRKRDDINKLNIPYPYGRMPIDVTRKITQAYYASVTYVDDLLGSVLEEVDFTNTIVVLTGDHGWSLGQHGEFAKYSNFQESTRVPLIVHVPRLSSRTVNVQSIVELVDIFPTLADLTQAGLPLPICPRNQMVDVCTEGKSLVPTMVDALKEKTLQEGAAFTQYPRPGAYPTRRPSTDEPRLKDIKIMGYSIKTGTHRFCDWVQFNAHDFNINWTKSYGSELYDHAIDPLEDLNLVDQPELKGVVDRLKRRLIRGWRN